jgi:LysR family hydrogen peroxide-inducible transcriptional activator
MPDANRRISLMFPRDQPTDESRHRLTETTRRAATTLGLAMSGPE